MSILISIYFDLREHTLSMSEVGGAGGRGGQRVLQIFQKIFRSPGDHRPKYCMGQ